MKDDAIWRAFAQTGDPVYYLLYKTVGGERPREDKRKKPGKAPRR